MKYSLIAAVVLMPTLATAQTPGGAPKLPPAPTVCVNAPERHQFDFWIGDWTVTPAGAPSITAGTSSVERIAGGCALLENWTAANGAQGKSINTYNPATKQWQQYWIGQNGVPTEYRESEMKGKTLVFLARATPMLRLSFTPLDDGTVQQLGEIWVDSTKSWQTTYDFRYKKR